MKAKTFLMLPVLFTACASRTNGLRLPPNLPPSADVSEWVVNQTRAYSTGQPRWANGQDRMSIYTDSVHRNKVLEVRYPRGVVGAEGGGAQWGSHLARPADRLRVSYDVQFAPGFQFVLGGKLPGLIGGRESGIPVTGGIHPNGNNGWSARLMWIEDGALVQYVYHMDQKGKYGDQIPWITARGPAKIQPGKWHHLASEIILNTPGKADGRIRSWFDGELVLDQGKFRFRATPKIQIDTLLFSTFFGGETPDWAPTRNEWIRFDNFEVNPTDVAFLTLPAN